MEINKRKKLQIIIYKNSVKYLIEFLIVAFGVFLGVFVSDWNSQNKIDQNTEKTLSYLIDEMDSNIDKLESTINYQTTLMHNVDSIVDGMIDKDFEETYYKNKKFKFNKLPNWQGFKFIALESIVFESAKINGVLQEFNISTTKIIARTYKRQDGYTKFSETINSRLVNMDSKTKVIDVLTTFELVKYDGLETEKRLLNELIKTKQELIEIKKNKQYKQ